MPPKHKSISHLKLSGTFDEDKHGPKTHAMDHMTSDFSDPPDSVRGTAREVWRELVPKLSAAKMIKDVDLPVVEACVRYFALWRDVMDLVEEALEMGDGTASGHLEMRARRAWQSFLDAAKAIGMTPIDRARLRASFGRDAPQDTEPGVEPQQDPAVRFNFN